MSDRRHKLASFLAAELIYICTPLGLADVGLEIKLGNGWQGINFLPGPQIK